jgi:hypothetical protein
MRALECALARERKNRPRSLLGPLSSFVSYALVEVSIGMA